MRLPHRRTNLLPKTRAQRFWERESRGHFTGPEKTPPRGRAFQSDNESGAHLKRISLLHRTARQRGFALLFRGSGGVGTLSACILRERRRATRGAIGRAIFHGGASARSRVAIHRVAGSDLGCSGLTRLRAAAGCVVGLREGTVERGRPRPVPGPAPFLWARTATHLETHRKDSAFTMELNVIFGVVLFCENSRWREKRKRRRVNTRVVPAAT
jgi:hypothetical protein